MAFSAEEDKVPTCNRKKEPKLEMDRMDWRDIREGKKKPSAPKSAESGAMGSAWLACHGDPAESARLLPAASAVAAESRISILLRSRARAPSSPFLHSGGVADLSVFSPTHLQSA